MPKPKWKRFERLVAAINATKMPGAEIFWDKKISGRQFDVVIQFEVGGHEYLTVCECKDYASAVPVEKVDAFVTKSRSVNANKAVMYSTSGFQAGAHRVADANGIDLYAVKESADYPEEWVASTLMPAVNIYDVELFIADEEEAINLSDNEYLSYQMKQSYISRDRMSLPVDFYTQSKIQQAINHLSYEETVLEVQFPTKTKIEVADVGVYEGLQRIRFKAKLIDAINYQGPLLDPYQLSRMHQIASVTDQAGKEHDRMRFGELLHGFDTVVEPGKFYTQPGTGYGYYCEKIEDGLITWWLVESFQHGKLVQAMMTQKTGYSNLYVPVSDPSLLKRWEMRRERMEGRQ